MKKENPKAWKIFTSYNSFIIFLVAECLAFVGFGLANVNTIYRFLGLVVALILLVYALLFSPKTERSTFIVFTIPLLLYSVIMCLSIFGSSYFGALENISLFIGLPSFLFMGFAVKKMKKVDIDIFFLTLGAAIALLLLISGIYSLTRYGFFHPILYKNMYYYYNGELFNVSREMKFLIGFSLPEVSIRYVGIFATIATGYLAPLAFLKPKENYKKFLLYLGIGLTGLLTNIFITNVFALIVCAIMLIFVMGFRFIPKNHSSNFIIKCILFILLGLIVLFFFIFAINAVAGGLPFIKDNAFYNRLFISSSYTKPWFDSIFMMTRPEGIFGMANYVTNGTYSMYLFNSKYGTSINFPVNSGSFILDACMEGGLFAFIAIIAFVVIALFSTFKYLYYGKDEQHRKSLVLAVLIGVFIYGNLFYDSMPLIHQNDVYYSFARSMPMLITLFFVGYSFYPLYKENVIEEELVAIEEQYQKDLLTNDKEEEDKDEE